MDVWKVNTFVLGENDGLALVSVTTTSTLSGANLRE